MPTLDEVAREGARRMLVVALEAEVEQYIRVARRRARRGWSASGRSKRPSAVAEGDLRGGDDEGPGTPRERPAG